MKQFAWIPAAVPLKRLSFGMRQRIRRSGSLFADSTIPPGFVGPPAKPAGRRREPSSEAARQPRRAPAIPLLGGPDGVR